MESSVLRHPVQKYRWNKQTIVCKHLSIVLKLSIALKIGQILFYILIQVCTIGS